MGNSKIPAYGGGCCGSVNVPVARVVQAPTTVVDYESVINKPRIADVELVGNKTLDELGFDETLAEYGFSIVSEEDVSALFD